MPTKEKRIVSLLPSTTEIIAALGLKNQIVGRSHECDFPSSVQSLPACTQPKFNPNGQNYQINERVKALLQEGLSVYRVDAERLAKLNPDFIITQDHCKVCAASVDEVKKATQKHLQSTVEIISVSPTNVSQVYDSITQIAEALDVVEAGVDLIKSMRDDLSSLKQQTKSLSNKTLLCIEWLDPLMSAGNWVPELAKIAGAKTLATEAGVHSPWINWENIVALNPQVICIMPCGYSIEDSIAEMHTLTAKEEWNDLKAVQNRQVFIMDGHHYFNRPGPRLTQSARILAEVLHPSPEPLFKTKGWVNFFEQNR
jgi:iron complex transport system substrate-binding protein